MPSGISRVTALGDLSPFGRSSKLNVYKKIWPRCNSKTQRIHYIRSKIYRFSCLNCLGNFWATFNKIGLLCIQINGSH